ncbi:MAG: sodium:proton antiporter [Geminicoccaceae bacterium]|nr:sodium:proton antiporter [Geminicoccaceae bacterium]
MSAFDIAAVLVVLTALFGYLNHQFLHLPQSIGLVVVSLFASFCVLLVDVVFPASTALADARDFVEGIDFYAAVMDGMLGFILFAGALHVNVADLREERLTVLLMATVGLLISTAIVGLGFAWLIGVPLLVALVFGALISPTDPVAVLGLLKIVRVPKEIQIRIGGESLFNDGVAVVVFLILVEIAFGGGQGGGGEEEGAGVALTVLRLFAQEALGGALLGAAAGWLTFFLLRRVDEYVLEVTLTLALVMGVYALATRLHTSGPIAVVVAGILIGNRGFEAGMSARTRLHVQNFWHLIDEILNAALFLLIGIEVLAIPFKLEQSLILSLAVPLVLLARLIAVYLPISLLSLHRTFTPGTKRILVWGGLRGGISVALALSLPGGEWKHLILEATYIVVVFSIIVQGLTMRRVVAAALPDAVKEQTEAEAS